MTNPRTLLALTAVLALAAPLAGCMGDPAPAATDGDKDTKAPTSYDTIMAKARELAGGLDSPQEAWDAGYRPDQFCVPGMGVHWVHKPGQPDSAFDLTLDENVPETLLFLPTTATPGDWMNQTFLGIEYVVVTEGQATNTTETVPALHNQTLAGPMAGHFPGMPWHAELHIYLAEGKTSTAAFPESLDSIVCPEGTTPPMPPAEGEAPVVEEKTTYETIMAKAVEVADALDTPQEAWDAGYRPDQFCIPGMGVHWTHMPPDAESAFDMALDENVPETLLFLPTTSTPGDWVNQTFLGIEYVVITEGQETNSTETVPTLHGQPFYGPMPGHFPGMPYHAELHIYLAEGIVSPAGFPQTADVTCPEGTTPPAPAASE